MEPESQERFTRWKAEAAMRKEEIWSRSIYVELPQRPSKSNISPEYAFRDGAQIRKGDGQGTPGPQLRCAQWFIYLHEGPPV